MSDTAEPDTPVFDAAASAPGALVPDAIPQPEPPRPGVALHLTLAPQDAARLPRLPDFARLRDGRPKTASIRTIWHDTPDSTLAKSGLALSECRAAGRTSWRLERTDPAPGMPPECVAEANSSEALGHPLPDMLMPVVAFEGQVRTYRLTAGAGGGRAVLHEGVLRAVMVERPVCRMVIEPATAGAFALARTLAGPLRLAVAETSLARDALDLARPGVGARRPDATLPPGLAVGDAFARIVSALSADLLGQAQAAAAGDRIEPVHRMRVALRRLRSAIQLFQRAVGSPELDLLRVELRELARVLGPARDWDVFLAGTGKAVAAAFEGDRAIARLLSAAGRRRAASYAALSARLAGPEFRRLGLTLAQIAMLRPWEAAGGDVEAGEEAERRTTLLSTELDAYAARALQRRMRRLSGVGDDVSALPMSELHALRIQGKRMRYASEFFAPLFPGRATRRFVRRLSMVQERFGQLNDSAVAAELMAELSHADRFAAGIVHGFVAARGQGARVRAERSWKRFVKTDPFWR